MTELLTRREAAEYLKVPVTTLANWAHRGRGPAYLRVGKHVRYRPESLEAWTKRQEINPEEVSAHEPDGPRAA